MEKYNLEQTGQEVQNILNEATPQSELTAETERAQLAEQQLQNDIDAIEEKIPSGASSSNKLATEEYVDDSVSTATATFRGTFNLVSDLGLTVDSTEQQIAAALASEISTADNNDYCFVQIPTSAETPTEIEEIDRYKFNGTAWSFEYELNNSGFTADQWNAINSHITSGDVAKLLALPTNAELTILLNGKQNVLTFDNVPTENSNNPVKSGGVYSAIDDEKGARINSDTALQQAIDGINGKIPSDASSENKLATASDVDDEATARSNADQSLQDAIEAILLLIPTAASSLNQLADKAFVNSSIATNTATFRGTFNLVNDLHLTLAATHAQVGNALALAILDSDNNDYCFVQIPTVETAPNEIAQTDRYKFNGSTWEYEYTLNNSGFTSAQWIAINSGITSVLVSKLSELPTNSELTSEFGALTTAINNINLKIPAAAAQNNKLVDTAALEAYIIQVLDVLTVTYNVTSSDGHITFHIAQTDGKITAVTLTTNDIASANDHTVLAGRVTTAENDIDSLEFRVGTNEADIALLQAAYGALTQSDIIIGALPASGVANKIYRVPGTSSYSDYMWNGTQFVLMATYNNAIDPRPKKASQNLVTSGGIFDNMGALDISELNATENPHTIATYADLSAALAAIPSNDYKKGGMSIKFVQTSDNNYIQYFCKAQTFTTNVADWEKMNLEEEVSQLNQEVFGISITQPTQADKVNGYVSASGTIVTGANWCVFVDVSKLNGFHISQLSATPGNQYAFLKSKGETSVEFVEGTGRVDAQLNNTLIPEGAVYLYILLGTNNSDPIPTLSLVEGETQPIREELEDVKNSLANKQDVIVENVPVQMEFSKDSDILEYVGDYYQNSNGELIASQYSHLYQFVAEKDIDLWWVSQTTGNDVILAIYRNGVASTANFIAPRMREDGSRHTMPTENNKLHISQGCLVTISYYTGDFVFAYSYDGKRFMQGISLSEEQVRQAQSEVVGRIKVVKNTDDYAIKINGYDVKLLHYINANRNADCWTIIEVNKNGNIVLPSGTDVVGVLKEIGQNNFMGGYAHGNEQIVDFHILADGVTVTDNVDCNVLDVFMYSHLYRVSNPTENIIDRYTHIQFKDNSIIVESTFKCLVDDFHLDIAYNGGMWAWRQSLAQFATTNIGILTASGTSGTSIFGMKHELISASALLSTGIVSAENILGFEQAKFKGEAYYYGNEGATARMKIYYSTDDNSTWESGHLCVGKACYTLN